MEIITGRTYPRDGIDSMLMEDATTTLPQPWRQGGAKFYGGKQNLGYYVTVDSIEVCRHIFLPCSGHCLETVASFVETKLSFYACIREFMAAKGVKFFFWPVVVNRRVLATAESTSQQRQSFSVNGQR